MTTRRSTLLQSLTSGFAVVAVVTTLGLVPKAHAADPAFSFYMTDGNSPSILVTKREVKSQDPNAGDFILGYVIAVGFASFPYAPAGPDRPVAKSLPNHGALAPIPGTLGSSHCLGSAGIAVDPSGKFIYMSGGIGSPGRLCGFVIDPVTQAWTPVEPAGATPNATGTLPSAVAIDPSGRFMYVPGGSIGGIGGNVTGFAIDSATGMPSPLPGSPYATSDGAPSSAVVDRAGRFLYVDQGSFDSGSIAVFAIDATTGALTAVPGSPFAHFASYARVAALALSPDGRFLFTGGQGIGTYAVNPTTGVPTPVAITGSSYFFGLAVDPTGRFLYASDFFGSVVRGFSIAADGRLTPVGTPQPIGSVSRAIVSVADLVYVASTGTDTIHAFRISPATGALAPVAGSPFAAAPLTNSLAARANLPSSITVDTGDNVVARVGVYGGRPPYAWSIASGALPPGLALNATTGVVSGIANVAGTYSFTVTSTDSLGATASAAKSIAVGGGTLAAVSAVEFYNASLDHYFITYVADEIAKLDNGTFKGWARTGLSFKAFATTQSGTSAVCRIYIPPGKGDGHFFGRDTNECDGTMAKNPTFVLESSAFIYLYPPTLGICAAGQVPVYRVFSNRADANHRYTTDRAVRDQMVGKGWLAEGDGADTVVMCAPA